MAVEHSRTTTSARTGLSLSALAWVLAVATYGVGDTGSTIILLELGGHEGAWLARWFLELAGYVGLVVHKLLILGVCAAVWRWYPAPFGLERDPWRLVVPVLMIVYGLGLLENNIGVILELAAI